MWSYIAAKKIEIFDEVYIAVDDVVIQKMVESFGAKALFTSKECLNGTERLIEAKKNYELNADIFVNWQADEPFIEEEMIRDLLQGCRKEGSIWTLKKEIRGEEVYRSDVVKVVTDRHDKSLYFSRSPIPFDRDQTFPIYYKHIGLYAYTKEALNQISSFGETPLSRSENLEQLVWLEEGLSIYAYTTEGSSIGIDTKEDLLEATKYIEIKKGR
jgi:3-deoxy-manno-octulosonate cytidylyltransferase (CMP-KDO synthetase)